MDEAAVRTTLARVAWVAGVVYVRQATSTNDEALARAAEGAPEGTVVVAERQTAGRGRLGRSWFSEAEPGAALTASWIVRPTLPLDAWSLIPLMAGVAAARAVTESGVRVRLKWPNDLLCGGRKLGGILVEARPPDAAVVGLGVNVSGALPAELASTATTIAAEGGSAAPAELLARTLEGFAQLLAAPQAVLAQYRALCATLGATVRVARSDGAMIDGVARDVDDRGALVLEHDGTTVTVLAGDVLHVRDAG